MYEQIRYEVDDPVATITLDRPGSMNAGTDTMGVEVRDAMTRAPTRTGPWSASS